MRGPTARDRSRIEHPAMRTELRSLTGVRGIAACWVMCGHFLNDVPMGDFLRRTIDHGYLAVDLFLVLSGFVLAMTYGAAFVAKPTAAQFARFLLQRLARIYPLYVVTTLVCLLLSLGGVSVWGDPKTSAAAILANLLLVQGWGWPNESLNATGWSISTEWAANMLFPLLVLWLLRWPLQRSFAVAATAFACLTLTALLVGQSGQDEPILGAVNWYTAPGSLLRCITEFMLGMLCWRLRGAAAWLGGNAAMLGLSAVLVLLCQSYALDLLLVPAICLFVIGLSLERSVVSRALGSPPVRWLGMISFSIYLWQMPLATLKPLLVAALDGRGIADSSTLADVTMMMIIISVAHVSLITIEKPAQRRLRRMIDRPMRAAVLELSR